MPDRRWNFGHDKITDLLKLCEKFIEKHGTDNETLQCAIGVLRTYLKEHESSGVKVPDAISSKISLLTAKIPGESVAQKRLSKDEYFSLADSKFPEFTQSRSSIRNYTSEKIPTSKIMDAIEIAQSAPSACNRQPIRVYVLQDRQQIDQALTCQNGNRGFGHLADTLIVITYSISSYRGAQERHFGWIDCGIFSMNLMLALHHLKIACCPLNAGMSTKKQNLVREICGIPTSEAVCLFLSCGNLPNNVDIARSTRKRVEDIVKVL
ncbi:nitroreductase family protein [Thiorhodococcus fuscus]|uniref:Nitroreductase family protein n=1 Tax=Thiorhodococcus fuscus TaxID=527200 RepID=A0ABW4YBU6_9GAMM